MDSTTGNILFYTSRGDFIGWLISTWTQSPYVHTAVQIDEKTVIEATDKGVVKRDVSTWTPGYIFNYQKFSTDLDLDDLAFGVAWLERQLGEQYGYVDFFTNANIFKKIFYLVWAKHYDCSALATRFLDIVHGVNLQGLGDDVHTVTPGDLYKVLQDAEKLAPS